MEEFITYVQYHPFVQQALLLGCHNEIVRVVLVVDDVLQVNACEQEAEVWGEEQAGRQGGGQ